MSLVLPGFGQLYNGQLNRAIWLFLLYCMLTVPGIAFVALYVPSGAMMAALTAGALATVALWIFGMVDAWRSAARQTDYVPRAWQTSGLYVAVFLVCGLLLQPALGGYVRKHEVESFRDPSSSMEPTLLPGDYFFADKRYNCPNCKDAVRRGDIVVFTYPNYRNNYYVKRVIGLPGERIQITGEDVLINGRSLALSATRAPSGSYVTEGSGHQQWRVWWSGSRGPRTGSAAAARAGIDIVVPQGEVFVLGDHRDFSYDSRDFGPVPLEDLVGKARQVWLSRGERGIRWSRLGEVVE